MAISTAAAIIGSAVIGGVASNKASKRAAAAQQGASDAAAQQAEIARDQWETYKSTYQPLEKELVADAQEFDSPERYREAAGQAAADVSSQFGLARERLTRQPGFDPSSAAAQSGMVGLDLAQAASGATSQNAARRNVRDMAWARKVDALGLGKGLPASASSMLSSSANTMGNIASNQYSLADSQSRTAGRVMDRVFSNPATSNWLGNVGTSMRYGTDIGSQQTRMLQEQELGM
jgi:hypothetical protein